MNILKETILSLLKHKFITFSTLAVLTFNLLMLGIFTEFIYNTNVLLEDVRNNVEISVFLEDALPKGKIDSILGQIRTKPSIDNCKYVSKEEALKEYSELPEFKSYIDSLKMNPLPDSIIINVNKKYKNNIERLKSIVNSLKSLEGVTEVYYQEAETQKIFDITDIMKKIILVLSLILMIGSLLIVSGMMRMSVFARRDEIKQMKSDGIPNSRIKGVFIMEGILEGATGGLFAVILLYILEIAAFDKINILWSGKWQTINIYHILFMVLLGVLLGFISSLLFRIKNYLK